MVDSRLVWNQIQTPDLSAASVALARANQSFNSGLNSAQGILKQYGAGIQQKNDNALAAQLAGLGSEAKFQAFVDKGGLKNLNISPAMRARVLAARRGQVDAAGVRARTGMTAAQTATIRATEGRNAANYAYGVRQRNELASLSSALVAARSEGRKYGNTTTGPQGSAFDNYINSTIQSESSGNPNARNPNSSATGTAQFTNATWAEMMTKHPELNLTANGRTDPAQSRRALEAFTRDNASFLQSANIPVNEGSLYAAHFLGRGGARAVLSAPDNAMVSNLVSADTIKSNPQLQNMTVGEFRQWASHKGGGGTPGPSVSTARDAFRAALANSSTLSPNQINALLNQANGAQAAGQGLADTAFAKATTQGKQLVHEIGSTIINQTLGNPNITLPSQFDAAIRNNPLSKNLTESEILALIQRAAGVRSTEAGKNILAPPVLGTPVLAANIANTVAAANTQLKSTDQNRAIADIGAFTKNPAASLTAALNLGKDGQSPTSITGFRSEIGFDQNKLRTMINDYAREFKVEPAVVAVAMRDAFQRNPFGRNTLANRFKHDAVKAAVAQLNQTAIRNFRESQSNNKLMAIELSALQTQATNLQRQIVKTHSPVQKRALQAQLDALNTQVSTIESRRQNIPPRQ